jgi:hypothetical protein
MNHFWYFLFAIRCADPIQSTDGSLINTFKVHKSKSLFLRKARRVW